MCLCVCACVRACVRACGSVSLEGGGPSKHQQRLVGSSGAPHTTTQHDASEGRNR